MPVNEFSFVSLCSVERWSVFDEVCVGNVRESELVFRCSIVDVRNLYTRWANLLKSPFIRNYFVSSYVC